MNAEDVLIGEVDRDGTPTGDRAVMPWWSFTKTLIAAAILRLAEHGRIALDTPLDGIGASPRALLGHRGGLPDYGWLPSYHEAVSRGDTPWSESAMLARLHPRFPPGRFSYSNVGYLHLRHLIERVGRAPFATALHDLVIEPLGLTAVVAGSHREMAACALPADRAYNPGWVYHGLVVGPVAEAALALYRILTGDFLAPTSRAMMLAAEPFSAPVEGRPWTATGYGLGLMIGTMRSGDHCLRVVGHSAGGPGSAGAVYRTLEHTVAAFTAGPGEARDEHEAAQRLAQA